MKWLRSVLCLIRRLELAASAVAGFILFVIMLIVVVDVIGRYLFRSPLGWSYDVISLYLTGSSFFLALSETLRRNHHVNVDILYNQFRSRTRCFWNAVGWTLASVLFICVCVLLASRAFESWSAKEVMDGPIAWPTWIGPAVASLGLLLICARLCLGALAFALAFATGSARYAAGTIEESSTGEAG